MEIAGFLIAFVVVLIAVWIGWRRIPIVWHRSRTKSRETGHDSGNGER